jgi:hypothetical protein
MKPIFFPSTYVSGCAAQALDACFGQFIVYQPLSEKIPSQMVPWLEKGILDVRVPVKKDQDELETLVKNYQSWADLHIDGSGLKIPFWKTWTDATPFFNATSTSQVVAEIKKQVGGKPDARGPEPLLKARLFLYLAQEFDRQNQEVVQDLKRHHQQEKELLRKLKMEDDVLSEEFQLKEAQLPDNSSDFMAKDRLEAWTRVLLADPYDSGLFITSAQAVFQELLDKTATAEKLLYFECLPLCTEPPPDFISWRQKLAAELAQIIGDERPPTAFRPSDMPDCPCDGQTISLRIFVAMGENPRDFFTRCSDIKPSGRETPGVSDNIKNTLFGLIEFNK